MALVEGMELIELARLFRGLVGNEPAKRLELLKKDITKNLPAFGALDGSDGPFLDWFSSCNQAQLLLVLHLLPTNPVVEGVLDRLEPDDEANGAPSDWHFLGRKVVLGRFRLRDKLPDLVNGTRRVALVRGKRFSGKTFTHLILRGKTRGQTPEIDVVYVNVMDQKTVRKIAVSAVSQMLGDPKNIPTNDPGASEDRASTQNWWVNQIADWIAAETRRDRALQRWLVFDGYDRLHQEPDITQLMGALAVRAIERIDDPNGFRVIFLDHPDLLPPGALDFHIREEIDRITELEVLDVLSKVFTNMKQDELNPIVQEVMAKTDDADTRLPIIQERLAKIVFKDR